MPLPLNLPGPGPEYVRRITDAEVVSAGGTFSVSHTWDAVIVSDPNITLRPIQGKPQAPRFVPRSRIITQAAVAATTSTVSHTWDAVVGPGPLTSPLRGTYPRPTVPPRSRIVPPPASTLTTSTLTHTWDAVVQKNFTATHTWDAVVQKTLTQTHTWDAVIVLSFGGTVEGRKPFENRTSLRGSRIVTVPFPILTTSTVTHTWDAVVQKTSTVTHTWDAVIVLAFGGTVKGRKPYENLSSLRGSRFTLATPVLQAGTLTHTWDAVVQKTSTVTHTWDAVIVLASSAVIKGRKPFENPTRLLTSRIVTIPFPILTTSTLTHTWDAVVKKTLTQTHTWDAVVFKTLTQTHTWDAVVQKTLTATHTWDALVDVPRGVAIRGRKPFENPTHLLASRIVTIPFPVQQAGTLTHTWDGVVLKTGTRTHTWDAVVQKTLTATHTWDALIIPPFSGTVRGRKPFENRTNLLGSRIPKSAVLPLITIVTHTWDGVVQKIGQTKTHTWDALILKTTTKTHTWDALILKTTTKTHTWDAVVKKTLTATHTWDAVVKKTLTRTHTWDALIQKTFTRTHTWDAVVLKTLTRTHTWDAVVKKSGLTRTHTWDAVVVPPSFGTFTRTHTWDAFIYNPYPQWPTDDGTQWPTDDGSNWAGGSGGPQWPTATSSGDKIRNGTADNPLQVGFDTLYGSWVGGADPGAVVSILTDGGGPVFSMSQTNATNQGLPIAVAGHRDTGYVAAGAGYWHLTFRIKAMQVTRSLEYYVAWWDSVLNGTELFFGNETLTTAQGWVERSYYFTLPSTAVHLSLNWRLNPGNALTGEVFRIDDIVLRQESQWRTTTSGGW